MMFYAGLFIYYLFLALSGGYFFAVIPTFMLYLIASLRPSRHIEFREIGYQDILYFSGKKELLRFLKEGKTRKREVSIPRGNLIALILTGLFFILTFAYAYHSVIPFLSVTGLAMLIGGLKHEETTP